MNAHSHQNVICNLYPENSNGLVNTVYSEILNRYNEPLVLRQKVFVLWPTRPRFET